MGRRTSYANTPESNDDLGHQISNRDDESRPAMYLAKGTTGREEGIGYGYATLLKGLRANIRHDPKSKLAFHCAPVGSFTPTKHKTNILLTMFESRDIPRDDIKKLRQVDVMLVPSAFCMEIYKRYVDCPIYQVPIGIDLGSHPYVKRTDPRKLGGKLRFLYLGSPDPRKGIVCIAKAWETAFARRDDVELYMKSTASNTDGIQTKGNMILDFRNLPRRELAKLYEDAHAFLWPSMGEGFGYPPAEAMASGLPVIGTHWSGHVDFLNHQTGFPIDYTLVRVHLGDAGKGKTLADHNGSLAEDKKFEVAMPHTASLIHQMKLVAKRYDRALAKGKTGSRLIHRRYDWGRFRYELGKVITNLV